MKIAFYISEKGTRLCEIIKDNRYRKLDNKLVFVISDNMNNSDEIQDLCKKNEIEWLYFDYKGIDNALTGKEKNRMLSDEILKELIKNEIDYLFVFGHHLLSGDLLNKYKNKIICFHPSLLPHFTGFGAIDQAIENDDFVIGNSAFLIDAGVDTGKVIMQSVMHVSNFENKNYNKLLQPIVDMFYYIVQILEQNRMIVLEDRVLIRDADYGQVQFFPPIE